jgi:hypothetical protein
MHKNLADDQSTRAPRGQSCPLCLQVDEEAAMIAVTLPTPRFELYGTVLICHGCAIAIAGRMLELECFAGVKLDTTETPSYGRPGTKAKSRKRQGRAATASDSSDSDAT